MRALVEDGPKAVSPFFVASTIPNMAACEVAIDLGVHGPVNASALACATGTYALLEARRLILAGEADVVIAGGGDAGINLAMFAGLSNMGPLSERNDDPEGASRPFDSDRDGFVFGEGAVVMVVESAEHAAARGAEAYGRVAGGALTADAFHMSAPEPSGRYAALAIETALRAGRDRAGGARLRLRPRHRHPRQRQLREPRRSAPSSATPPTRIPVCSPKSMVGHLIGAAGALAAMACLLGDPRRRRAADDQPRQPRPRVRPRPRRQRGPRDPGPRRDRQRLRLRRPELRSRPDRARVAAASLAPQPATRARVARRARAAISALSVASGRVAPRAASTAIPLASASCVPISSSADS